jgi:hypothetical protein
VTPRENAKLVLHVTSSGDPISRAARRAAEDVLRLENVRAAAARVAKHSRSKWARLLKQTLDAAAN